MRRKLGIGLLLAVVTLLVYAPAARNGFVVLNDPSYVVNNPHVRDGLAPAGVRWAWASFREGGYPLAWLSHMLDCQLFGLKPAGHHLMNVLLHVLNTLLLFAVLSRMTGSAGRSAFVAALFAVHPLQVESVAWVAARRDLLGSFFGFLALGAYAAYSAKGGWGRYLLVAAWFVLGLMSAPMVMILPLVLLLLDAWPLQRCKLRSWPVLVAEKLPLVLLSLAMAALTCAARQKAAGAIPAENLTAGYRLAGMAVACASYIGKMFWPRGLAVFYPPPGGVIPWGGVLPGAAILLAMTTLAVLVRRSQPHMLMGWLWYLGALLPAIALALPGERAMADRHAYVPLVGLFIMIVWGVAEAASGRGQRGLGVAGAVVLLALAVQAHAQVGSWRSSETLFRRALAVTADNWFAEYALGNVLAADGRVDEAIGHYREAVRIQPGYLEPRRQLGLVLSARAQTDEALWQYMEALRRRPDDIRVRLGLAATLLAMDRPEEAMEQYREALRLDPNSVDALNNLAWMLVTGRAPASAERKAALDYAGRAAAATPRRDPVVLDTLAAAYAANGHFKKAAETARQAIDLARGGGRNALAAEIEQRLALYEKGRAWNGNPGIPE